MKDLRLGPEFEFAEAKLHPACKLWVAREDQAQYLQDNGYPFATAIGLPSVYVPRSGSSRVPNTLLVVPAHSLDYTTHAWKFDEYVESIRQIMPDFECVVALVHQSCIRHGFWVRNFQQLGIPIIEGAHTSDSSTLPRLEYLFSTFEFATTNSAGSHVPYAAAWGSKVSIWGQYAELREQDFANCPFFQNFPHLLGPACESQSERAIRKNFPEFFVDHPKRATERIEWGEFQVGADNRHSPHELRKAFGWTLSKRNITRAYAFAASTAKKCLPEQAKRSLESRLFPDLRRKYQLQDELRRIKQIKPNASGFTNVLGQKFEYSEALDCAHCLEQTFERQVLEFSTEKDANQLIIDVNPGEGMSTLYFSQQYPNAKIIAIEANLELRETLLANLRRFDASNVEVLKPVEWRANATTSTLDAAASPQKGVGYDAQPVGLQLRSLLKTEIDMIRITVCGEEVDLLLDVTDLLINVKHIFVEYRSAFGKRQRLNEIIALLAESGFRVHITNPSPAERPLIVRPVKLGYDMLLEIFAVRDHLHSDESTA